MQLLFVGCSYSQDLSVNLLVAEPTLDTISQVQNIKGIIKSGIENAIIGVSDYITLVEREDLDKVKECRLSLQNEDDPDVASASMIGANYLLKSQVRNIRFKTGEKAIGKDARSTKPKDRFVYWHKINYTIDFELVDITTGEVVFKYKMSPDGLGYEVLTSKYPPRLDIMRKSLLESKQCMGNIIQYMIMSSLVVKSRIIGISKIKKDKAKQILIKGGSRAPFRGGLEFDIIKVYTQDLLDQKILRQEKIGTAQFEEKYDRLSMCTVSEGTKEVLTAYNNGFALYCVPKDLKQVEKCELFLGLKSKTANAVSFAAATKSPNKKTVTPIIISKKRTKNTKKVKRKNQSKKSLHKKNKN